MTESIALGLLEILLRKGHFSWDPRDWPNMRVECILGWWVDEYEIPAFEVRKNMLCYKHTPKKTAFGRKEL